MGELLNHLVLIVIMIILMLVIHNLIVRYNSQGDCYIPPNIICEYQRCIAAGLNYSRTVDLNRSGEYMCICLNGTEEIIR